MKRIFVFTSIALLLSILVTNTTFAAGSVPTSASGTNTTTSASFDSVRVEGGNMIIDLTSTVTYTGTFNGTSTVHGLLIFHAGGTGVQFPPWRALEQCKCTYYIPG